MVEVPTASASAWPPAPPPGPPPAVVTAATLASEDAHVACPVTTAVVPSLYSSVATNAWVCPTLIDGAAGVTTSFAGVAVDTVSEAVAESPLYVAVTATVPAERPVASPRPPPPPPGPPPPVLMLAMAPFEVVHEALLVTVCMVPSSKVTSAVNCCVPWSSTAADVGVTSRPVATGSRTVRVTLAENPL